MKVIIAPDSYKGCLDSIAVAKAMESGVLRADPEAEIVKIPMADGGEGTVEALLVALGGEKHQVKATDPIGNSIDSFIGITHGGAAIIEMAAASGLPLVPEHQRNPMRTSSYGTGELLKAALEKGAKSIIIGIGGSATNDGGMGMARALGAHFYGEGDTELMGCGEDLKKVVKVDLSGIPQALKNIPIRVACDVNNPLCGTNGASAVYGPQKGADPEMVMFLDSGLFHYSKIIEDSVGKAYANLPGAGAAGGMGFALMALLGAELLPGVQIVTEAARLSEIAADADFILTGEGATDEQTAFGKVPVGIAACVGELNKKVIVLSGRVDMGYEEVLKLGVTAVFSVINKPMNLDSAMANASSLISDSAEMVARMLG